jgi:hypothetical protein
MTAPRRRLGIRMLLEQAVIGDLGGSAVNTTRLLYTLLVGALLIALTGCLATARQGRFSDWLPILSTPSGTALSDWERMRALTGATADPEVVWLDKMDLNGDFREDAVVTAAFGEASGARGHLITHMTYVFLGEQPPNAVFTLASARYWFSLPTRSYHAQTRFPDVEIRRQFSVSRSARGWNLHIRETLHTNEAGDSSTRGMYLLRTKDTVVALDNLASWVPMRE